jgi:hypothetical protein
MSGARAQARGPCKGEAGVEMAGALRLYSCSNCITGKRLQRPLPIKTGHAISKLEQRAVAAVFIAPVKNAPQMPAAALALVYDLTPAEACVLELIANGRRCATDGRPSFILPGMLISRWPICCRSPADRAMASVSAFDA